MSTIDSSRRGVTMGASPVAVEQNQQQAEAGQVVHLPGSLVANTGPDDHNKIIDLLVPPPGAASTPKVRFIQTSGGQDIRLGRICHYQPGTGKFVLYPHRQRDRMTLNITDISALQL